MKSKVLLIDDSVTIHRVIDLSIDVDRYDIVKVFSKEDAALKMQSEQYDYILLDNKLDNIVISEYIKELKTAQTSAYIILLVGAFDRFDESDLEKTGADDYLVKPFDSQSLNEKLSSDADMMPAGIVEKIAEADFARDNDDYITPTASLTTGDVIDGLSKKEYLENLEEVQPDDLTDNGYAEDLDTAAPSLELDNSSQEVEESSGTSENEVIEESLEEDTSTVIENNNEETENSALDDTAEAAPFEEPVLEPEPVIQNEEETIETENNEEVLNIPEAEENSADNEDISLTEEISEETAPENNEEIEIPDNITAVHNPVLPDIDDAADISDEYVMQDNLEEIDDISQNEMLDEFPDFPEVDDISTDEMQDSQDIENIQAQETENIEELSEENSINETSSEEMQEVSDNTPAKTEEQETLLVDDDDWLSDTPSTQEENTADMQMEEAHVDLSEESLVENQEAVEDNELIDNALQEEAAAAPVQEETEIQEQVEPEEAPVMLDENTADETAVEDDMQDLDIQEQSQEDLSEENATDELSEMPSEEAFDIENEKTEEENIAEEPVEPLSEETIEESAEDTSFDMPEVKAEDAAEVNEDTALEETSLSVQEEMKQEPANIQQTEVKQAEEYSPETSGRFGGITVTISRDEIIAMLGNAIDKHFLEEAVKEVIAANMKDIVRNIVPAIAEKYIKEEIERLKNDE